MRIKDWFVDKNFDSNQAYAIRNAEIGLIKETEKALYVKAITDFGNIEFWVPKSCVISEEEYQAESKKSVDLITKGFEYNEYLRNVALKNGLKIGNIKTTIKLIAKLEENGIAFDSKENFKPEIVEVNNTVIEASEVEHPEFGLIKIVDQDVSITTVQLQNGSKKLLATSYINSLLN